MRIRVTQQDRSGGHDDQEATGASSTSRRGSYAIPRNMTQHGRTAFADLVDDYVSSITHLVEAEAQRGRGGGHEWTADHVAAARAVLARQQRGRGEDSDDRTMSLRTASAILVTAGVVGVPTMSPLLNSPWQLALFFLFALLLLTGLILSWTTRGRT
jgi:hypothetical protein